MLSQFLKDQVTSRRPEFLKNRIGNAIAKKAAEEIEADFNSTMQSRVGNHKHEVFSFSPEFSGNLEKMPSPCREESEEEQVTLIMDKIERKPADKVFKV